MYAGNDVTMEYIYNLNFKQVIKNYTMFIFHADSTDCPVVSSQSKGEPGQHLGEGPKGDCRLGNGKREIDVCLVLFVF